MSHFKLTMLGLFAGSMFTLAQAQDHTTPPEVVKVEKQELAHGDPARWYKDDATRAAQMRTLHKEIIAAFQEANVACKKGPSSERTACLRDARSTYQQDMANAEQIREENHRAQ